MAEGRDLYRDVWLVSQQAWFAAEIARRFGAPPRRGRLARLERDAALRRPGARPTRSPPGRGSSSRPCARRARRSRSRSATAPGASRSRARDNGYSLRALAPARRLRRPALLPDAGRPAAAGPDARLRLRAVRAASASPVVLEEFGVSSDFASDDHAADYYRQVLTRRCSPAPAAGSPGTTATTTTSGTRIPTAITSSSSTSGSPTATAARRRSCACSREFAELVRRPRRARLGARRRRRGDRRARALRARPARSPSPAYRQDIRDNLLQAYVAAREADLPVELVARARRARRRRAPVPRSLRKLLTAPGLDRLRELATAGATVVRSRTSPAARPNQRGPWLAWLDEIFGVRHRLRYGLVDPIVDDEVVVRVRARTSATAGRARGSPSASAASAERPRLPAGRASRRRGRRRRRPRPARAAPQRARCGLRRALHLPARAPGRADAVGEPREHLADLLRPRGRGRRLEAGARRRPARARWPDPDRPDRARLLRQLLQRDDPAPSRSCPTAWSSPRRRGADARALRRRVRTLRTSAPWQRRHRSSLRCPRWPRPKGGMPGSERGLPVGRADGGRGGRRPGWPRPVKGATISATTDREEYDHVADEEGKDRSRRRHARHRRRRRRRFSLGWECKRRRSQRARAAAQPDALHERQPVVAEQRPQPGQELGLRDRARRLRLRDAVPLRPAQGQVHPVARHERASGRSKIDVRDDDPARASSGATARR